MRLIGIITLVLSSSVSPVCAQSLHDVETKFGAPIRSYSVSESIWMSPEFSADGQLCQARLYPKKIDATNNYLSSPLRPWEIKDVFDRLAPLAVRGVQKEDFGTLITGNMLFAGFSYEHVRINFVSSLSSLAVPANQTREVSEFPGVHSAEIVTITWLNRTCASR
jgi:hypothetical protein